MLRKIRRIVAGHNAQGKSVIASDAPSPHVLALMADPPFGVNPGVGKFQFPQVGD